MQNMSKRREPVSSNCCSFGDFKYSCIVMYLDDNTVAIFI